MKQRGARLSTVPDDAMDLHEVRTTPSRERFRVDVRLLDDPCLWQWEIYDTLLDAVVLSSWNHEWAAYPTREEAQASASARLRSLAPPIRREGFGGWRFGATRR